MVPAAVTRGVEAWERVMGLASINTYGAYFTSIRRAGKRGKRAQLVCYVVTSVFVAVATTATVAGAVTIQPQPAF